MTLIKILKPNAPPQRAAKLRNTFFFHRIGQHLFHLERVVGMNFLPVKVTKRICIRVILTIFLTIWSVEHDALQKILISKIRGKDDVHFVS